MKYLTIRNYFFFSFYNFYLKYDSFLVNNAELFLTEYNKISFFEKKINFNFFQKFTKTGLKKGFLLKFLKNIFFGFSLFFFLFKFNSNFLFKKYLNIYNIFYFFSRTSNFFFNINYIFSLIVYPHQPIFGIKCEKIQKRYVKKLKKRFSFKFTYIP